MEWTNQLAAIGVVLLLTVLFASAVRRSRRLPVWPRRRSGQAELEVIRRVAMGPQHILHQVRWGKTDLLVAVYPSGCSVLQTRDSTASGFRNSNELQGVSDEPASQ